VVRVILKIILLLIVFNLFAVVRIQAIESASMPQPPETNKIIVIHGLTGDAAGWTSLERSLTEKGYEVILFNLPGHGGSREDLRGVTWRDWVDAVQEVIDRESQDGKVSIFGHSMGGLLAVYVGNLEGNSDKISSTVTFGAAFQNFTLKERVGIYLSPIIQIFRPYYQVSGGREMPFSMLRDYLALNTAAKKSADKNIIRQLSLHGIRDQSIPVAEAQENLMGKPNIQFETLDQPHYPESKEGFEEIALKIMDFLEP